MPIVKYCDKCALVPVASPSVSTATGKMFIDSHISDRLLTSVEAHQYGQADMCYPKRKTQRCFYGAVVAGEEG